MQAPDESRPASKPGSMIDNDPNSVRRECRHNKDTYVHFYRNLKGIIETDEKKPIESVKLTAFRSYRDKDSKGDGGPTTSKVQSGNSMGNTEDSEGKATPPDNHYGDKTSPQETDGDKTPPQETEDDKKPPLETDGDKKPPQETDGDKTPPQEPDGDKKPAQKTDGDKKPLQVTDGDKTLPQETDGDKKPPQKTDGDKKPLQVINADKKPPQETDVDKKLPQEIDGDKTPPQETDGDKKPPQETNGDKKPPQKTDGKSPIVNEPRMGDVNDGIQVDTEGTIAEENPLENPNNDDGFCFKCLSVTVQICNTCKLCTIM